MKPVTCSERFNDIGEIEFPGRLYEGKLHNGSYERSAKGLMTLEESHFQVLKTPNRSSMDVRYQLANVLMTLE
jgi:hypothetical protein